MTEPLRARIEAAQRALRDSEQRLSAAIAEGGAMARADKTEVSREVRAALSKLRATKAKLEHLESALASSSLEAARSALDEAERELDALIDKMRPAPRSQKQWMAPLEEALDRVTDARATLGELREALEASDD